MVKKSLIALLTAGTVLAGTAIISIDGCSNPERLTNSVETYSPSITTADNTACSSNYPPNLEAKPSDSTASQPDLTNKLEKLKRRSGTNLLDLTDSLTLLATVAHEEAGICPKIDKKGVVQTVFNRLKLGIYGETIREVIFAPNQYSFMNVYDPVKGIALDDEMDSTSIKVWADCIDAATRAGKYPDPTDGATHYFNPDEAKPLWRFELEKIGRLQEGNTKSIHVFYKES